MGRRSIGRVLDEIVFFLLLMKTHFVFFKFLSFAFDVKTLNLTNPFNVIKFYIVILHYFRHLVMVAYGVVRLQRFRASSYIRAVYT